MPPSPQIIKAAIELAEAPMTQTKPKTSIRCPSILFSAPMIRALEEGRKTQHRVVINPQPEYSKKKKCWMWGRCRFKVGDRIAVKESWGYVGGDEYLYMADRSQVGYRADHIALDPIPGGSWRSAQSMPRWASRFTLEITDIRVNKLQDMHWKSDEFLAEGIVFPATDLYPDINTASKLERYFVKFWDSNNGKRPGCTWNDNPFVWALTFKDITNEL